MKKKLLLLIFICGIYQLKAQDVLGVKPADSISNNFFKVKPRSKLQLFNPQLNFNRALNNTTVNNLLSNVDHMPVIALAGNSKMPIKKIGGYYTMPVKRMGSEGQLPGGQNFFPGMPVFKTP